MTTIQPSAHFVDNYMINPTNPITVNLIGAGGTGSQVLTALSRINHALLQLRHPGLQVKVFDDDVITPANLGRQLFAASEIGQPKAVALINRINRFFGTNWKAVEEKVAVNKTNPDKYMAHVTISCVDTAAARFTIAEILRLAETQSRFHLRPLYWMDFGNSQHTGQVILSTIGTIEQPPSKKFRTIAQFPFITEEFKNDLKNTHEDDQPSCSLAEALHKQDLFINSTLANLGCSLLWNMLREGMIHYRGFFLNLKTLQSQGIPIN